MTPCASVTEIDPTPVSPARAEARLGAQSASGAPGPPTRRLCSDSWRSEASPAVNVPRTYSETIEARLSARLPADRRTSARREVRSAVRSAPSVRITPVVNAAIAVFPRDAIGRRLRGELGERALDAVQERGLEGDVGAEIAQQVRDGKPAGFVEQPPRREGARRIRELRLRAGEAAEPGLQRAQRHRRSRRRLFLRPLEVARFERRR